MNFSQVKRLLDKPIDILDFEDLDIFTFMAVHNNNLVLMLSSDACRELAIASLRDLSSRRKRKLINGYQLRFHKESGLAENYYDGCYCDFDYKKHFSSDYLLLFVNGGSTAGLSYALYTLNSIEKRAGVKKTCVYESNNGHIFLFSSDWAYSPVLLSAFLYYIKNTISFYKLPTPNVEDLESDIAIILKNKENIFLKKNLNFTSYGIFNFYGWAKEGGIWEKNFKRFLKIKNG